MFSHGHQHQKDWWVQCSYQKLWYRQGDEQACGRDDPEHAEADAAMNLRMKFSIDVMHIHHKDHANRFQWGPSPFRFPIAHNANTGPVQLLGLPLALLLPSNDGMDSPLNKKNNSDDLEAPGSGNPDNKKQQRTDGWSLPGRADKCCLLCFLEFVNRRSNLASRIHLRQ